VKRRILVVDDDVAVVLTLRAVLELSGFEVETANSVSQAVEKMESGVYQMVITDLRMETEDSGLEVMRAARRQSYDPATALLTAYPPDHQNWRQETTESILIKPMGTKELIRQLEALLIRHEDEKQLRHRDRIPGGGVDDLNRKAG